MKFNVYSYSNQGGRDYNEDYCGYWQDSGRGAFIVSDGLGGHGHGEVASEVATTAALDALLRNFGISDDALLELIKKANQAVLRRQAEDPALKNMRTTIVAGVYSGRVFRYFNVGDSRLYYFKGGRVFRQTKDHSVPQLAVELGEITPDEIRYSEDRSKLLKVLGDSDNLNIKKIEPEVEIERGDAILLCTDGLWEHVLESEMEQDLAVSDLPQEWCELMCARLSARVSGGNDNYTLLCGMVAGDAKL